MTGLIMPERAVNMHYIALAGVPPPAAFKSVHSRDAFAEPVESMFDTLMHTMYGRHVIANMIVGYK